MEDRRPDVDALEPIERASIDELRALQLERLRWSLRHAYEHVEHTRRAFDAAGVHPDDCRQLADLARFPFTTKADLREQYPFGMFAVPREEIVRIHASSGTTGRPTVVGSTADDLDTWAWLVARSMRAAGVRPGDRVHNAYGYGLFTGGLGLHAGAERLGCMVIPVSGGMTERQVLLIRDFEPEVITVTPVVHAGDRRRDRAPGDRPSLDVVAGRHLRGRAVDQRDARGAGGAARHACHRHVRPLRGDGPRCGVRVHRDQGRTAPLGGPLLAGDHRPGHRSRCSPTARRESWS